jgi:hypothetical protein
MTWSPLNLTGICGFWRADMGVTRSSGNVTAWADQTANGLTMTNVAGTGPTWSATAFNGAYPGVDFGSGGGSSTNYLQTVNNADIASSKSLSLWLLWYARSNVTGRLMAQCPQGSGSDYVAPNCMVYCDGGAGSSAGIGPYINSIGGNGSTFTLATTPAYVLGIFTWNGTDSIGYDAAVEATPVGVTDTLGGSGQAISFGSPSSGVADMIVAAGGFCSNYTMNTSSDIPNVITWCNTTFGTSFSGGAVAASLMQQQLIFM